MKLSIFFNSTAGILMQIKLNSLSMIAIIIGTLFWLFEISVYKEVLLLGGVLMIIKYAGRYFARPKTEPDWSLVYPQLAGGRPEEFKDETEELERLRAMVMQLEQELVQLKK